MDNIKQYFAIGLMVQCLMFWIRQMYMYWLKDGETAKRGDESGRSLGNMGRQPPTSCIPLSLTLSTLVPCALCYRRRAPFPRRSRGPLPCAPLAILHCAVSHRNERRAGKSSTSTPRKNA